MEADHRGPGLRHGRVLVLGDAAYRNAGVAMLGLEVLAIVVLVANAWGLRSRFPS